MKESHGKLERETRHRDAKLEPSKEPNKLAMARMHLLHFNAKYSQLSIYASNNLVMCHIRHTFCFGIFRFR